MIQFVFVVLMAAAAMTSAEVGVSPGHLLDIFSDIHQATGTFPDDKDEYTQLSIVNRPTSHCLTILNRKSGNGAQVGVDKCYLTNVESPELFWLRHAGDGYVALATPWNRCVGGGERNGALLWTGDWCQEDSFKFAIVDISPNGVRLRNKASGRYVTAADDAKQQAVTLDGAGDADERQRWTFCDPAGRLCWPPPPPTTTHAPTTRAPTTHAPTTRAPTTHAPTTTKYSVTTSDNKIWEDDYDFDYLNGTENA